MAETLRWGILATGRIARKFATGLQDAEGAELVAVGSRTQQKANAFADEFDIPRRHGSYEALAGDADVEAIYVATPHPMHKDAAILCLEAGKAVLCEKPFAVNAAEAAAVVDVARERNVFCMEAMWSRFLPSIVKLGDLIAGGVIGEVRMVLADFGFRCGWDPQGRLLNPDLAGGGLLDVGIYPISLAGMILGRATEAVGLAHLGESGVDEQAGMVFKYEGGRLAVMATGVQTQTPMEATILGTEGRIRCHGPWWRGNPLTVEVNGRDPETIDVPKVGNGYNYEADEVARCIAAGKTESDAMPLDETLHVMQMMDSLREQWGLRYPFE